MSPKGEIPLRSPEIREYKSRLVEMKKNLQEHDVNSEMEAFLSDHDAETLAQVDEALERIKEGVYATCLECERLIPRSRLDVLPHTPHCVQCSEKIARRQKTTRENIFELAPEFED